MKRPEKIVIWLHVEQEKDGVLVDHNKKPLSKFSVTIPFWLAKAFRLRYARIEVMEKTPSFADRQKEEDSTKLHEYFRENWSEKMSKMRKLNHNYMLVQTKAKGEGWFKSLADYENYHRELAELNSKYGLGKGEG